jgi:hypothetical protein
MRPRVLLTGFIAVAGMAWGQPTAAPNALPFPRFNLIKGQIDGGVEGNGEPISGAKLCILQKPIVCYQMPPETASDSGKITYQFGLEPRSERLALSDGGSWIFFSAMFSAGGSGTLERLAVLRYQYDGTHEKIVNLLPFVGATNVSERAMWSLPSISAYPILVHAEFIWSEGEIHFGQHFYDVEAWCFDPKSDHYVKAFSYRTAKKYAGGDSTSIHVLSPERDEILKHLQNK